MAKEIERKWLIARIPSRAAVMSQSRIMQGYLGTLNPGEREVRVRSREGVGYTLTIKAGAGMEREETEVRLTKAAFYELWPETEGMRVRKIRTVVDLGDHEAEVDEYEGLSLMTVEVEFRDEADALAFEPPEWFGEEVTSRVEYKNRSLASNGLPDA